MLNASARFDEIVDGLQRTYNCSHEDAIRAAQRTLGVSGSGAAIPAVDQRALEKAIEHAGDQLMQKLGFEVLRFSHPGKTKQTPGIADRRYCRRRRIVERADGRFVVPGVCVWWEAKSATGEQRPGQAVFQELVTESGDHYVLGTTDALVEWLLERGIARRVGAELELTREYAP